MYGFQLWKGPLLFSSLVMVAFGAALAFLTGLPVFDAFNTQFNTHFWGAAPLTDAEVGCQRWMNGVMGATMVGWGIFSFFIVRHLFKRKGPWAWNSILVGVMAWFVIDTGITV